LWVDGFILPELAFKIKYNLTKKANLSTISAKGGHMTYLSNYLAEQKKRNPRFYEMDFAKGVGISPEHLSRLKNGTHRPGIKLALKLQKFSKGKLKALKLMTDNLEEEL
jgi:transcriptional regulator with XRE-family HTH domain